MARSEGSRGESASQDEKTLVPTGEIQKEKLQDVQETNVQPFDSDWKTVNFLVEENQSSIPLIEEIVGLYFKESGSDGEKRDPSTFLVPRYDANNNVRTHLKPELVRFVREKLHAREVAPKGWKTVKPLAKKFNVDFEVVRNNAEPYREKHPEWFKMYLDERGSLREYLHPDLVEILSMLNKLRGEKAPEGWKTNKSVWSELSEVYSIDKSTVKDIAQEYLFLHPEYCKPYLTLRGRRAPHYHPDLVEHIRKEVARTKKKK